MTHLKLNLGAKPVIHNIGINVHGRLAIERFTMQERWSLHCYRWTGALEFQGHRFEIRPGYVSLAPPNTLLTWRFPSTDAAHCFIHFGEGRTPWRLTPFPVMQDLGARFAALWAEFEDLIALHAREPLRAEVRFWDLLLRLSRHPHQGAESRPDMSPPLRTVLAILDNELGRAPSVAVLARRVGVSRNQLTRLFRRQFGMTAIEYLQARRLARVRHLLEHSCLPIKVIAGEVGMPDLHQFNKFFKKRTGLPPREYRRRETVRQRAASR